MYLIAEIGINHNGDMNKVDSLITEAAFAGADAVKFQKRDINTVYTKEFLDGPRVSPWGTTQRDQKEGLELSYENYQEINEICFSRNVQWFASSWDFESLAMMDRFDPPFHKISSAFNNHIQFIGAVGSLGRPVMLSTGMASLPVIDQAVKILRKCNVPIILMHCVSIYPCPDELCNIRAILSLKANFPDCQVGYSGHERGITPTLMAIGLGAEHIERHFTLDRTDYGSDQSASLEPKGLKLISEYGKQILECLGTGALTVHPDEEKCAKALRYWL